MASNRKLKNFIIYPHFQWRLILMIMLLSLIAPVIIICFQVVSFQKQIDLGHILGLPESHPYFIFYSQYQSQAATVFAGAMIFSLTLCFVLGLMISHRVAGPLVKLRLHFESISANGKDSECPSFRENDFFRDLVKSYNSRFGSKAEAKK